MEKDNKKSSHRNSKGEVLGDCDKAKRQGLRGDKSICTRSQI